MAVTVIPNLSKKDQRAQIHGVRIEGTTAHVTISPALIEANYTSQEREMMIDAAMRAAKRHIHWPKRTQGKGPMPARFSPSKGTPTILQVDVGKER